MPKDAVPVRAVMQRNVVCLSPVTPLDGVIKLFADHRISGAPVVDERGEVVGILTKTDLMVHSLDCELETYLTPHILQMLFAEEHEADPPPLPRKKDVLAGDIMTRSPLTIAADLPVGAAARIMVERRYHHLLVAEGRKVVGILSPLDLLGLLMSPDGNV